jgi:hypothetical protein
MHELSPEQWAEVERLFDRAAELPGSERGEFLERECSDPDVRREVTSLLEHTSTHLTAVGAAIAATAADMAREPDPDERLTGARLGPYKVEAIAGHGGMGAENTSIIRTSLRLKSLYFVRASTERRSSG